MVCALDYEAGKLVPCYHALAMYDRYRVRGPIYEAGDPGSIPGIQSILFRFRFRVLAGLPTGYSVLGGNLAGFCYQQYRPRLDNWGGNDTHRGLCWK